MTFTLADTPLRQLARKCWPKERHTTSGAAEAQLRSIVRRELEKDLSRIHTYRCPHCAGWHVGHSSRGAAS